MAKFSNAARTEALLKELPEEDQKKMERWAIAISAIVGPLLIGGLVWATIYP